MTSIQVRSAFTLSFVVLMLTSCINAKKLDDMVRVHYNDEFPKLANRTNTGSVQVINNLPDTGKLHSKSTQHTEKFLPLIVYWRWHFVMNTRINGTIPYTLIANSAQQQARNRKLEEKLGTRFLELTVKQLPQSFSLRDEAHLIFLLLAYFGWDKVYFLPAKNPLQVDYRLLDGNTVLKTGTVTLDDPNKLTPVSPYKKAQTAIDDYLSRYDTYMKELGKQLVDKLFQEL